MSDTAITDTELIVAPEEVIAEIPETPELPNTQQLRVLGPVPDIKEVDPRFISTAGKFQSLFIPQIYDVYKPEDLRDCETAMRVYELQFEKLRGQILGDSTLEPEQRQQKLQEEKVEQAEVYGELHKRWQRIREDQAGIPILAKKLSYADSQVIDKKISEYIGRTLRQVLDTKATIKSEDEEDLFQDAQTLFNHLMFLSQEIRDDVFDPDARTLRMLENNMPVSLAIARNKHKGDTPEAVREAMLAAFICYKGKSEEQVALIEVQDFEVDLTEEEEAELTMDLDQQNDAEAMEFYEKRKREIYDVHKEQILSEKKMEATSVRKLFGDSTDAELETAIIKALVLDSLNKKASDMKQDWEIWYEMLDPNREISKEIGKSSLKTYMRFFDSLDELRHAKSEFPDLWEFLVDMHNRITMVRTKEDVEGQAVYIPFRANMELMPAVGGAVANPDIQ